MKNINKILPIILFLLFIITPFIYGKYTSRYTETIILNVSKPVYDVAFHSNDGNNTTIRQGFVYGTSQALRANSYTRTNYVFTGWNTAANGSGNSYSNSQIVNRLTSINNGTFDLYAQWRRELLFTVTGNPSNWTNQDVTLTIVPEVPDNYLYSFDGGDTWSSSSSHTFSSNQTVNMKIKLQDGFTSRLVTESITKIDKIAPSINFSMDPIIVTLDESNPISSILSASDNDSGIDNVGLKVYRHVVADDLITDEITNTNYFTYPGLYSILAEVSDTAGNTTSIDSEILVRWPTGGKYVVKKTILDGADIAGSGHSVSTDSDGLFEDTADTGYDSNIDFSSKYYYTGSTVDNYLSFASQTFRIINVAENDTIKVLGDVSDLSVTWGNNKIYNSNIYNTWSTIWWVNGEIYNNNANESKYHLFTNEEKAHIALATFYAGRVNDNDNVTNIISSERTNATNLGGNSASFQGYSAYPNVSDFLKASKTYDTITRLEDIDTASLESVRTTFKNNSWIDMNVEYWTMNGRTGTLLQNSDFWVIDNDLGGHFESRLYSNGQQYRVVFYITDDTILSGIGSQLDPYIVEEDWSWFDDVQVLE